MTDDNPSTRGSTASGSVTHDTNELSIIAVADLCAAIGARSAQLFEYCGQLIARAAPGPLQRWWAQACHQHAWHIDLAADRMPTIPLVDSPTLVGNARQRLAQRSPTDSDVESWRAQVEELRGLIADSTARIEPNLDPSTARMVSLVDGDLARLWEGLSLIARPDAGQ